MIITMQIRSSDDMHYLLNLLNNTNCIRLNNCLSSYISFTFNSVNINYTISVYSKIIDELSKLDSFNVTCKLENELPKYNQIKDFMRRGQLAFVQPNIPRQMPTIYQRLSDISQLQNFILNYSIGKSPIEYTIMKGMQDEQEQSN